MGKKSKCEGKHIHFVGLEKKRKKGKQNKGSNKKQTNQTKVQQQETNPSLRQFQSSRLFTPPILSIILFTTYAILI